LRAADFLAALRGAARFFAAFFADFFADFFATFLATFFFAAFFLAARFFVDFLAVFLAAGLRFLEAFLPDFFADFFAAFFAFFFIAMMNLLRCTLVRRLRRKPAGPPSRQTRRAIHRRMQMLCRRDTPRNAFVFPQIREMRGTGSALTADADEFGTARANKLAPADLKPGARLTRTQERRRNEAGV